MLGFEGGILRELPLMPLSAWNAACRAGNSSPATFTLVETQTGIIATRLETVRISVRLSVAEGSLF
jgi:hypothetical protein